MNGILYTKDQKVFFITDVPPIESFQEPNLKFLTLKIVDISSEKYVPFIFNVDNISIINIVEDEEEWKLKLKEAKELISGEPVKPRLQIPRMDK